MLIRFGLFVEAGVSLNMKSCKELLKSILCTKYKSLVDQLQTCAYMMKLFPQGSFSFAQVHILVLKIDYLCKQDNNFAQTFMLACDLHLERLFSFPHFDEQHKRELILEVKNCISVTKCCKLSPSSAIRALFFFKLCSQNLPP